MNSLRTFRRVTDHASGIQRTHDAVESDDHGLYTSRDDYDARPIEDCQARNRVESIERTEREPDPGADVQSHHAPWLCHDAAELPLYTNCLSERSDIGGEERKDGGPVRAVGRKEAAVGDAGEDHDVRDAVGQVVEDLSPGTRPPRGERHHAVEHVHPQTHVAQDWCNEEKNRSISGSPEAQRGECRGDY